MPSESYANVVAARAADKARLGGGALHGGRAPEADVIYSLNSNPLGALRGEANLVTPFNTPKVRPIIKVRNFSRTKKRRICVVPVSAFHGAEEAITYSKSYKDMYNVSMIYELAKTRDMSIYEDVIKPCWLKISFDSVERYIAPAPEDDPDNPPFEVVDEGCWDLYCGNYERMHASIKEQAEETARLANLWLKKRNPTWRTNDCGLITESANPFGFVEFLRELPQEAPTTRDDKPFLTALDLVE